MDARLTPAPVCTLPPEVCLVPSTSASDLADPSKQYCKYGGTVKKCQEWLQKNHEDMYDRIWSAEALEAATASLSVEAQKRAAKDAQKKAAKAEAAEQKQADKLAKSVVTIKRIERNKKKFVTAVIGLEAFGLELKRVSDPIRHPNPRTTGADARHRLQRTWAKSLPPDRPSLKSPAAAKRLSSRAT